MRKTVHDKIKIAHVTGWLHFAGKENGIVNLVNNLDPDLFENFIFTFMKDGPLTSRINPDRCQVFEFGDKLGGDYRLYFKLAQMFRRCRIHIAHTHSWATLLEGVIGAKLARVPIVIHGEHGTIKADTKRHLHIQRLFWHATDQVLSVSEVLREKLSSTIGYPKAQIRVIANGVDLARFDALRNDVDYKAPVSLPPETVTFGTVGRLVPVKAYPNLLKACKLIVQEIPRAHLLVVGDGPLNDELMFMVRDYKLTDHVQFLGWRADVPEILKELDVYVLASDSEGMSNTILEAMSSGLPVVATAVGGNRELVIDGETGVLVPPNHPQALARAVIKLLRDPDKRRKMGQLGRQRILKHFCLDTMVRNYAHLYIETFLRRFKLNWGLHEKLCKKQFV